MVLWFFMATEETSGLLSYLEHTLEYIPVVVGAHLSQGFLIAALAGGSTYIASQIAMKKIAKGDFAFEKGVPATTTDYWPDIQENPEGVDVRYYDQQITNFSRINLAAVFNPERNAQGKAILSEVKRAIKEAKTGSSPIVYSHISDHLKGQTLDGTKEAISRLSRGYFSDIFNDEQAFLRVSSNNQYRPVMDTILPLLVVEPNSNGILAEKIMYLKIHDGNLPELPARQYVRYPDLESESFDPEFILDPDHPHKDRYLLIERVLDDLQKPENKWMAQLGVQMPSGEFRHIQTGEITASPSLVS